MKRLWFQQYLLFQYLALVVSQSYYSINAPGIIKSNRKYTVVVALHEATGPCSLRVTIEGPSFQVFKDVNLKPFEIKSLEFLPKKLLDGHYKLIAEGLSGLIFKNESKLFARTDNGPKIYIQTDKAIYKPKDVVNFRIVILDEHTKPLNIEEPVRVEILDNQDNRVKQFKDVELVKGVYTGKFQLSEYPVLGTWKIKTVLGGKYAYTASKSISISNYILPKFSVYLKTPKDVVLEDGYIKVVLYGKYTFNKYVEGNATVELWDTSTRTVFQKKSIDIDNLGYVEFNIDNLKNQNDLYGITVRANITEKHTGRTETDNVYVSLRRQRYDIIIPYDDIEFNNSIPFRIKAEVKHWTGAPVLDRLTTITMEHGGDVYKEFLNENGTTIFEFKHHNLANHVFQFKDSKKMFPNIYQHENLMLNNTEYYCRLKLLNTKLILGNLVQIEVSSIANIPYLMYTVMGHASLIRSEHIKVPANQKSYTIQITPTIEFIPESFLYVYYVHKGNLRYEELRLNFPNEFENQVSLAVPRQVKPGENVIITINAQPQSYVSILAVDLGVYLLDSSYDLSKTEIINDLLDEKSYSPISASVYPGLISGLLTLTNANYPFEDLGGVNAVKSFMPLNLKFRQKFPETWIFDNYQINDSITQLSLQIPETVTTWRITAFTNNDVTGFGIVNGPTDITTIQPLFISLNLPYAVKRGEIVSIPITIFNYLNQTVDVEVILYNNNEEFYFMESKLSGVEKSSDVQQQRKLITVQVNKAETINFFIFPIQVGEISLRISASSILYSDAVLKKLKVEPEGVARQKSQALYISVPAGEKISSTFNVELPEERVPDSEYFTFSVGGHYLVPTVENFHDLIQMPTGCGEQNMVNFAPSILILQYLKTNDRLTKEKSLVLSLRSSIETSYQQQLSFRHLNGGYSVFGEKTDDEASTWLTAYVLRYFIKASKLISVEAKIIETGLEYLAKQQYPHGEFPYTGYLLQKNQMNPYGLTAFVLIAFLEDNKYAIKYNGVIQKGLEFLDANMQNIDDVYALSIVATVLKLTKSNKVNNVIKQLQLYGREERGLKWWSGNDVNPANDIEITAYTAMCLLETPGDHTSVLKWLIEQRNANGGFSSSHDTVVGMEALVKFSEKYKILKNMNLKIIYKAQDVRGNVIKEGEFYVDSDNMLVLQKDELPKNTRHLLFEMEGSGASLVQLTHQYNIDNVNEFRNFNITPKPILKNQDEMNLEICFTYQPDQYIRQDDVKDATNMVIMEANLPSGFVSEAETTFSLKENDLVQRIETKNSESTVILYLDSLEAHVNHCLNIPADKTNEVLMPKPAAIIMYDYYNLSRSNTEFYSL